MAGVYATERYHRGTGATVRHYHSWHPHHRHGWYLSAPALAYTRWHGGTVAYVYAHVGALVEWIKV